jgi:polyisoprenoid-binding protein YceI
MIRFLLFAVTSLFAVADGARAADWTMVAATSRLEFAATFEGNAAPGSFRDFDARMRFDADTPTKGSLDVAIVVTSADMNSREVNNAIAGPDWFDFARFPRAEFHSTDIKTAGANRYLASGTLNLKGVQQALEVPFTWTEADGIAQMGGEFVVKRNAFGIGTGQWASTNVIGPDVKISFHVRLRKSG